MKIIAVAILAVGLFVLPAAEASAQNTANTPIQGTNVGIDNPGRMTKQKTGGKKQATSRSNTPTQKDTAGNGIGGTDVGLDGIPGRLGKSSQQKDRAKSQR